MEYRARLGARKLGLYESVFVGNLVHEPDVERTLTKGVVGLVVRIQGVPRSSLSLLTLTIICAEAQRGRYALSPKIGALYVS